MAQALAQENNMISKPTWWGIIKLFMKAIWYHVPLSHQCQIEDVDNPVLSKISL
jgi:hypothetical protein